MEWTTADILDLSQQSNRYIAASLMGMDDAELLSLRDGLDSMLSDKSSDSLEALDALSSQVDTAIVSRWTFSVRHKK